MACRCGIKTTLFCTLALASGCLQAQDFDLDSAVAYALKNNPKLNAVQYRVNASAARTQVNKAGHLPTLTLSHTARVSEILLMLLPIN